MNSNKNINIIIFPFLLLFFEMMAYLSSDMYLPALPTVMQSFHLSHAQAQLTLTSWFLGAVSVQLLLGPIADYYGRKVVLCFGGWLFIIATLFCAMTSDFNTFVTMRFFQGMGICFMAVPGYATIHELFEQTKAIKILALMSSISVMAPALGPLFGSAVLTFTNWRWIFGILAILSSTSIILLMIFMPETLPSEKRHPLHLSKILRTYFNILTNPRFILIITMFGLLFCGFITWIAAGPFVVINQFHKSAIIFSICQALIFLSNIIANHVVKKYVDVIGTKRLVHISIMICFIISIISLGLSILFPTMMIGIILTYIVYSFGSGLSFSSLNRLTIETSNEPMGSRMAVFSTILSGFAALSSILVSLFYHNTLLSLSSIIFVLMLIAFLLHCIYERLEKK